MLQRRALVEELLRNRGGLLVVTGLGSPTYDVAACGDSPLNFYLWGAMGSAAMVGLGLALARPERRVAVITGDGEMLMGLGALATIGVKQPENLAIVVLDNRHYGETGMQASHTGRGTSLTGVATACGFRQALSLSRQEDVAAVRHAVQAAAGPVLVQAHVDTAEVERVLPLRDGHEIRLRFTHAVAGR